MGLVFLYCMQNGRGKEGETFLKGGTAMMMRRKTLQVGLLLIIRKLCGIWLYLEAAWAECPLPCCVKARRVTVCCLKLVLL